MILKLNKKKLLSQKNKKSQKFIKNIRITEYRPLFADPIPRSTSVRECY